MNGAAPRSLPRLRKAVDGAMQRLSPRQRQYATLIAILAGGVGLLWLIFTSNGSDSPKGTRPTSGAPSAVTNIGVMAPGQQVSPVDQWVGTAGSKLAQYESEREEQGRLNKDRQAFEAITMKRFAELEQRLTSSAQAAAAPPMPQAVAPALSAPPPAPPAPALGPLPAPTTYPPATALPLPPRTTSTEPTPAFGYGLAATPGALPAVATLTRISVSERPKHTDDSPGRDSSPAPPADQSDGTVASFLPVSFTRGTLIGGLDAPTGGQAQSNPHPVLIRLSDNSVLPNKFRGQYRECFVVAAGYGDISSERAYLRTESLSCVRDDGTALEVRIQGSVYGEDGKVGMRGRLVTKQGQMLANALLAGVVGGIGQGVASASTTYSTSPLGAVGTAQGMDAYRAGIGTGVGRALDRLAQYYIKLAENTFPVIEVDAAREIDVVITKGVRIDGTAAPVATDTRRDVHARQRHRESDDDTEY